MKKRIIFAGLGFAACTVAGLVAARSYSTQPPPRTAAAPAPIPVNDVEVQVGDVPIVLTGIG
ncbi:MAG TPA: hypothetical protein VE650_13595, partial [Acetobacteraceae bacterium]|nr:hypothetical protein [Acetobacteraceae bacterium]